jgi:ABC-type nitrate/sulfonate/bicarbonate transport system permease component
LAALIRRFGSIAIVLLAWELVVDAAVVDPKFLPAVHTIALALADLMTGNELWGNLAASVYRAIAGLLVGSVVGVMVGVLMGTSRAAKGFFGPLVAMTYSLPKASLVPLFMLWFGIGDITNMATVFLATLLPVVVSTYHGVKAVPPQLVWSAQAMGSSSWHVLRRVLVPAASLQIMTGIRIALGFSWVLTLSAEMIAAKTGIGKLIFLYGENGAYAYMFAGIMAILAVAYVADRLMVSLMGHMLFWHDSAELADEPQS